MLVSCSLFVYLKMNRNQTYILKVSELEASHSMIFNRQHNFDFVHDFIEFSLPNLWTVECHRVRNFIEFDSIIPIWVKNDSIDNTILRESWINEVEIDSKLALIISYFLWNFVFTLPNFVPFRYFPTNDSENEWLSVVLSMWW